jgi:hypothetical protein
MNKTSANVLRDCSVCCLGTLQEFAMVVRNAKTGKFSEIIAGDQLRKELVEGVPFAGFKVAVLVLLKFAC